MRGILDVTAHFLTNSVPFDANDRIKRSHQFRVFELINGKWIKSGSVNEIKMVRQSGAITFGSVIG